jgi:hypothetical protein
MLGALVRQDDLEEFWNKPDFLESGCTTTKQQVKCSKPGGKAQGHVGWSLGDAGLLLFVRASHRQAGRLTEPLAMDTRERHELPTLPAILTPYVSGIPAPALQ